jgi:trehalose-6-phosphate synthase
LLHAAVRWIRPTNQTPKLNERRKLTYLPPQHCAILPRGTVCNKRLSAIGIYPIGIEPEKVFSGVKTPEVENGVAELKQAYGGRKVLLGIDRLDYIKGIPLKLLAMEHFLLQHPEWIGHVVLVQVVIPSREDLKDNQILLSELERLTDKINTNFGK